MKLASIWALAAASFWALSAPVAAHPLDFTATLSGAAEVPANASPAVGTALVTFDDDSFTMRVQATFSGLLGNVTAAHIHCCTATAGAGNAGVATPTPTFPGFPSGVTSGSYDRSFDLSQAASWNAAYINANGGTVASAFSAFASGLNSGRAYFNVHTTAFGGGEIRGTLQAVPEPSSYGLMLGGLAVAGWAVRRRRVGGLLPAAD